MILKKIALLICLVSIVACSFAQSVSLKNDTIYANKLPYALLKRVQAKSVGYSVLALDGTRLMELHNAHVDIKAKPAYVVTFLNDKKQGMVVSDAHFPVSFINEVVKYNVISKGASVNEQSELQFLKVHPLPDGYTDVDKLIEY